MLNFRKLNMVFINYWSISVEKIVTVEESYTRKS